MLALLRQINYCQYHISLICCNIKPESRYCSCILVNISFTEKTLRRSVTFLNTDTHAAVQSDLDFVFYFPFGRLHIIIPYLLSL